MESFDEILANRWRSETGFDADVSSFWPLCRTFTCAGLLTANEEDVGAVKIGPFTMVTSQSLDGVCKSFIESAFGCVFAIITGGDPSVSIAQAAIQFVADTFCEAFLNGALIKDSNAWLVLISIRSENRLGKFPTEDDLAMNTSLSTMDVTSALKVLANTKLLSGKEIIFLHKGGYNSVV